MKTRMTISLDADIAEQIRREAHRDGVDVSTWMARTARQEAARRSYAAAAQERHMVGLYSQERLDALATRREAVRRHRASG